jgi:glycerophosphoryl diester phosphodiesterase
MTKDGAVVLSHDGAVILAEGRARPIATSTLDEVRTWNVARGHAGTFTIPTLEEALEHLPDVLLNVDCKPGDPRAAEALVRTVRQARAQERVLIASFRARTLRQVRGLGYEGKTGLGQSEIARLVALPRVLLRASARVATPRRCRRARSESASIRLGSWRPATPSGSSCTTGRSTIRGRRGASRISGRTGS